MKRLFLSLLLVLAACHSDPPELSGLPLARKFIQAEDYDSAEVVLVRELETDPQNSEARRLLASLYLGRVGVSFVDYYDFLVTLNLDLFPEPTKIFDEDFLGDKRLGALLSTWEDLYRKWDALPALNRDQRQALRQSLLVLDGGGDRATVQYRLFLKLIDLKNDFNEFVLPADCLSATEEVSRFLGLATDKLRSAILDYQWVNEAELSDLLSKVNLLRQQSEKLATTAETLRGWNSAELPSGLFGGQKCD